ncbi:MAG TPA: NAD(P)-dependent oxidoreductase [Candidatus Agrococcus pullicola]|uniref:NAD(P)-dependent oxidoreductase n=1 Tax=Candidatus Agrococcus pullicola TaxID=2838429 RepID=A0A9D1YTW3_9MICO|nr:NAD(P)-dependent oxidoreductase [Candidatus Agrococcus pullicola]
MSTSLKRVVVTGASGFIGGAVATALADAGHEVVGYGRRPNGWQHPRGSYRQRDLTRDAIPEVRDAQVVVHAAALTDEWMGWEDAFDTNVRVTGRLVQTGSAARLVHISSASVYDPYTPTVLGCEAEQLPRRYPNAYGATKSIAERIVAMHPNCIALRPRAVYGPADATLSSRLLARVRMGVLPLPGGGAFEQTVTHIETLVDAVERSLDSAVTGPVNVGDAEPVAIGRFILDVLAASGRRARILPVPVDAALSLASRAEGLAKVTGRKPSLTRYAVMQLGFERTLDLSRLNEELGAVPRPTSLQFMR